MSTTKIPGFLAKNAGLARLLQPGLEARQPSRRGKHPAVPEAKEQRLIRLGGHGWTGTPPGMLDRRNQGTRASSLQPHLPGNDYDPVREFGLRSLFVHVSKPTVLASGFLVGRARSSTRWSAARISEVGDRDYFLVHKDGYPGKAKQVNALGHTPSFASPGLQLIWVHITD